MVMTSGNGDIMTSTGKKKAKSHSISMSNKKDLKNRISRKMGNNFEALSDQFIRSVVMQAFFIEAVASPLKNPFQENPIQPV